MQMVLDMFTDNYKAQVIWECHKRWAIPRCVSDEDVWEKFLIAYEERQFWHDRVRHHFLGELIELNDDWFFSAVHSKIFIKPQCEDF